MLLAQIAACPICGGSGACRECKGLGILSCAFCDGLGCEECDNTGSVTCVPCDGTGRCWQCDGRGLVRTPGTFTR